MTQTQPKQAGFFSNLLFNILIPVIILMKLSSPEYLGPALGVVVALAFPIGYGLYDLKRSHKVNGFSVLGVVSVILTGGISLLELDPQYIAIKEAAVPGVIGVAVLVSHFTRFPLIKKLLMNDQVINVARFEQAVEERGNRPAFERVLRVSTYLVAGAFFLSATLNYILARWIVVSPAGTTAFNEELGRMTALSFPVIALPTMLVMFAAIFYLFYQMKKLTGQSVENFLHAHDKDSTSDSSNH
ncbi:VC0807 family protein [Aliidiomarina soli]|uniref:MFS transporter n=1 Tax=Aliidiomarina soli TaxID=1928574 RepID=A0A432WEE6_9GAMM|nr:VC0807 family protein [Aliidiomarina soli]RUO31254.1 MFS transporter [Aliidiomarina soli]